MLTPLLTPQERRALFALALLLSVGGGLRVLEATSPRILSLTLGDSLALGFAPEAPGSSARSDPASGSGVDSLPAPSENEAGPAYDADGRLDLNRASAGELETLPGIGPKTAARIVEDRERRGRFRRASDLTRVKGIGPKTLARLLPLVTVSSRPDSAR